VYEPEFANVLKHTERQGNTLSVILRQAWDGTGAIRALTKNSPARATGAHVSMIGHITAEELRRYLTQARLGEFLESYVAGRTDVRPRTTINLDQTSRLTKSRPAPPTPSGFG
jgi:hypothetical protein